MYNRQTKQSYPVSEDGINACVVVHIVSKFNENSNNKLMLHLVRYAFRNIICKVID